MEIARDLDAQDVDQEIPAEDVFVAPSVYERETLAGASYTHHSPLPIIVNDDPSTECVLGVDEAGRGPVLGTNPHLRWLETRLMI